MNLKKFFRSILSGLKRKPKEAYDIWKDSKYIIQYAFTANGVDYYCFDDLVNKPFERALTAVDFYSELQMNCDHDYLVLHVKAIRELCNAQKISIGEIYKLNEQMAERLAMIRSPELIYKLASVVYFDKRENPTTYDFKYNQKKIESWKEAFPDGSFFLQKPIQTLMPLLVDSDLNLSTYQSLWEKIAKLHSENLLSALSGKSNKNAKNNPVKS